MTNYYKDAISAQKMDYIQSSVRKRSKILLQFLCQNKIEILVPMLWFK